MTPETFASFVDHTALKPDVTESDVVQVCEEAIRYGFASVCVPPIWVGRAAEVLHGELPAPGTVVGFPLGNAASIAKVYEAAEAMERGARELDMVLQVGALRSGRDDLVLADIAGVVDVTRSSGVIVKVIVETALLDDAQKRRACRIAVEAGADYVKTSTGFGEAGATPYDVALMRATVGARAGVKAAGGIRDVDTALAMIDAGADRLGMSASVAVISALRSRYPRSS